MATLRITDRAIEIINNLPVKKLTSKILKVILNFLEKYFGAEILVKFSSEFFGIDSKILKAINTGHKIRSLGIIKNAIKRPQPSDEPFFYNYYSASVNNAYGTGVDFFSEEKALWRSLGEATERYLWFNSNDFFKKNITSSYKNFKNKALNIFSLAGFSEEQKKVLPILQFNENTIFSWVKTRSLISKKLIFSPVQLVSSFYFQQKVKNWQDQEKIEPMLRWCVTTGLATGRNLEESVAKGILEVIERDAFMISYLNKLSPPIIDLKHLSSQDEEIAKIIKNFERYNLEVYILQLPTDFPVYISLAIIIDRTGLGPALSVGASADFDFKTAFLAALSESLIVRKGLKNKFNKEIDLKKIGREARLIYWAKIENLPKIDFFLRGTKAQLDLKQNLYKIQDDKNYYKEKLKFLTEEFKKKNYEVCFAELTTKEVKKIGFRCAQTVIPELQPMHLNESIPYFGGKRLKDIPLKLGYQPIVNLNKEPHPFP